MNTVSPTIKPPLDTKSARLLILDGHAYAYRAFYAIRKLNAPDGTATNALFGFIKTLEKLRLQCSPTHWMVMWDGGLAAERLDALPEYKAQRPPMPDALASQLPRIQEFLQAARIPSFQKEGIEADDAIATLARQAANDGAEVIVASSDKDFMQLVADRIHLLPPNEDAGRPWSKDQVREKTGVDPAQIVDWLSLVGDKVDNIPGVPGVGTKGATNLLNRFGTVDALYANLNLIEPDSLRQRLTEAKTHVRRNQQLIRLQFDVPLGCSWRELAVQPADQERLNNLFAVWGFKSLRSPQAPVLQQAELF